MSFETYMKDWSNGKRALDCKTFYEIRPTNTSLQDCEVLQRGVEAVNDILLHKENICWLRGTGNNLICCYSIDNSFRELSFKQLDLLFGDEIRQGGIKNNVQLLSNGIEVPIVPEKFIEEITNKHEQKKRRVLYAQKIKKKNLNEMNSMLYFFNMDSAPTVEESHESIHVIPPNLLYSPAGADVEKETDDVPLRKRIIAILETTRDKIKNHPVYRSRLETSIFKDVHSVADLLKVTVTDQNGNSVAIAQSLVDLYNLLFPNNSP